MTEHEEIEEIRRRRKDASDQCLLLNISMLSQFAMEIDAIREYSFCKGSRWTLIPGVGVVPPDDWRDYEVYHPLIAPEMIFAECQHIQDYMRKNRTFIDEAMAFLKDHPDREEVDHGEESQGDDNA